MNTNSSRFPWVWPEWLEDIASLPSDPDGHANLSSPDPLDWALHGLPSDPNHAQGAYIMRALGGLERAPMLYVRSRDFCPDPAWGPDAFLESSRAPDFAALSPDQRLEIAFLASLCRGADPWSWGDAPAGGVPLRSFRMLGELFSRRLLVAASAMLSHPGCPPHARTRESLVKVVGSGAPLRSFSLASGLALANDVEAMGVLIRKGGPRLGTGNPSPLKHARSAEMVRLILQSEATLAREVFRALTSWLSPAAHGQAAAPSIPDSVRNDLVCEVQAWWNENGLGDEKQWEAQVACLNAIVHKPGSRTDNTPVGVFDAWLRKVGAFRGSIWIPDIIQDTPGQAGVMHGMRSIPSNTVHAWLTDRSQAKTLWGWGPGERPAGQPWYWQGRLERLESWKELEQCLGPAGDMGAWEKAWGRFWSWVPPLADWTEEDAKQAARLWKMEHRPCNWPPPGWSLDDMGPDFLSGLAPQVRQIAGETFALSMVEGALVKEGAPQMSAGMRSKEWWGFRVQERMRWLEAWLETPGWKAPFLNNEREQVLLSWPIGREGKSRGEIASIWASRAMEDVLDISEPIPAFPRVRL